MIPPACPCRKQAGFPAYVGPVEPYSARVSPQTDHQQAVPAARRPRPPRPLRPLRRTPDVPGVRQPRDVPDGAREGARTPGARPGSTGARRGSALQRVLTRTPPKEALATAMSRLPAPRLTALGAGVLAVLLMMAIGALDALLLGGSPTTYGVCSVLVSVVSALWVRPADLFAAPVAAPLAYAAGLLFVSPGGEGFGGTVMGLVSGLSFQAGWVYSGTLAAGLLAVVRRVVFVRQRRAERRARAVAAAAAPGRG